MEVRGVDQFLTWPHGPWDCEYGQHPDLRFCHLSLSKGVLQM